MVDGFAPIGSDPAWFPAKIDWSAKSVIFRRLDLAAFYNVPFHDGRDGFLQTVAKAVPIQSLVDDTAGSNRQPPNRLILHHAFCGSTFLARLLSHQGRTVSYREPQVFIEATEDPRGAAIEPLTRALLRQFSAGPGGETTAFIKPSNWINPVWARSSALYGSRLVLIHMDIDDFIIANLRGGTARISYSLNLLNFALNFAPEWKGAARDAQGLLAASGIDATLRLLAILHSIQCRDFDHIIARGDVSALQISHQDLRRDPVDTGVSCAAWLDLGLAREDLRAKYETLSGQHAKSLAPQTYRRAAEAAVNTDIASRYAREIASAADWARAQSSLHAAASGSHIA